MIISDNGYGRLQTLNVIRPQFTRWHSSDSARFFPLPRLITLNSGLKGNVGLIRCREIIL